MSTLRECLKRPTPYLACVGVAACALAIDAGRQPEGQFSAHAYLALVQTYQNHARPLLEGRVMCRYQPSCSEYSAEAVRTWGIAGGLVLTARRIARCQNSVPFGTEDPVPRKRVEGTRSKTEDRSETADPGTPAGP